VIAERTFDHERLDVYRLSIGYVAFSYRFARSLSGVNRPARDQWWRAAQTIQLTIADGNGKQSLKDKNRFLEIARGSALECASIHDVLRVFDAIDEESNLRGKSDLKRVVSMLIGLIQRTEAISKDRIESSTSTAMLSTRTKQARKSDEQSNARERRNTCDLNPYPSPAAT
jgi:four helix bundle protein